MTRCDACDNGVRRPDSRARAAERDGRAALVLGVPIEVCDACGQVWLAMEAAKRLDMLFTAMLTSDPEVAPRHYDGARPAAA